MRRLSLLASVVLALSGCSSAPRIEHIVVDDSSLALRNRVQVVTASQRQFAAVQPVTALSCRRLAWDPDASEEDAVAQLKIKAARLDANGLTNVRCEPPTAATLQPNCWKSVVCHGDAVRLE